jgi:putative transposase
MSTDPIPSRKTRGFLHVPPDWVDTEATFLITINCQLRGKPQLTCENVSTKLLATVNFYHEAQRWWPEIFLLMPDHLHALVSFSWKPNKGINRVLSDWKRYTARAFGIDWQRDFHDHRIRSEADHAEKWAYIRNNPVRAGLVDDLEDWPHVWQFKK